MARIFVSIAAFSLLVLIVTVQPAKSQSPEEWREAGEGNNSSLHLKQSYHGTNPGDGNTLPHVEALKDLPGSWVTWPGFTMRPDGGSRIFIQTTHPLTYKKSSKKKSLHLYFKDTKIHLSNNKNPLITIHFNTPVKRAYLKRKSRHKTELVVELKVGTTPEITQATGQDGYSYMFIDFPPGQYPMGGNLGVRPSFYGVGAPSSVAPVPQASDNEALQKTSNSQK